jgi:2-oxoisovalerate dehydrogenase E1 component
VIPWDKQAVLASVRRTGKVLIVQEDTFTGSFAGEIAATIAAEAFTDLDAPVERMTTPDVPIPYNFNLMEVVLPGVERIREKMDALLGY